MSRSIAIICLLSCCGMLAAATAVPMIKNGNVRYGPARDAGVIVTMNVGDTVEVLRRLGDHPGWYEVRFPRAGRAWIHEKVVVPGDEEKTLRVIVDDARVRSDATIGGDVIANLKIGDVVEMKGHKVGSWHAVYAPQATAYVFHTVLDPQALASVSDRPAGTGTAGGTAAEPGISEIERLWRDLQQTYREYHGIYTRNRAEASTLPWASMIEPLKRVEKEHPDTRTCLLAERMRRVIARMIHVRTDPLSPESLGIAPEKPAQPEQPVAQPEQPVSQPTQQPEQPVTQPEQPVAQPEQPVAQPEQPVAQPEQPVAQPAGTSVVEGWIEPRNIPGLGARFIILGKDHGVAAFISLPADSKINLKPHNWSYVRATGVLKPTTDKLPPEYAKVPTLELTDIRVIN